MKKFTISLMLLLLVFSNSFAYEFLQLVHVDQWGWNEEGYIDSAAILVEPQGLYANCELIIDFSSGYAGDADFDVLEVEMGFHLPPESHITDLYLWIEDEPIQAFIFDTWTANLIYESIVQRRIDPSILTKTGSNEYNLKVYPIYAEMPRRIKMQFIAPIDNIMGATQSLSLPFNILNLSATNPEKFKIAFKETEEYSNPALLEDGELSFTLKTDHDFGLCQIAEIDNLSGMNSGTLLFNRKYSTNDFYLATYESEKTTENYFELALDHSDLIGLTNHKKAVYMLDFIDANCSTYDKANLLESLKYSIHNEFSEVDSFNVLISGLESYFLNDEWIPADSASIEYYFDSLDLQLFNDYSNLPTLLVDGINFIKNNGNSGSLILIASSNSNGSRDQANSLITDYIESLDNKDIPIHIIDLDDQYYNYNQMYYIGGQYFRGNEYFYTRLSQMTAGEYYSIMNYSIVTMLENVNNRVSGYFKSLELFIQTSGGYTFANYKLNETGGLIYNNEALKLIGKYIGDAPFYISLWGQSSTNEIFHFEQTILPEDVQEGDSIIELCWSANYIQELMGMEQSNQIVNEIVNTSIDNRVLSYYTAFLVLEPDFEIPDNLEQPPEINDWITVPTDVIQTEEKNTSITNYPNPFTSTTTISYTIPERATIRLEIYNSSGQIIEVLVDEELDQGNYTLELEASDYEKGLYFCIMRINGEVAGKLKLVVM